MNRYIVDLDIDELEVHLYNIAREWCNETATGSEDWTPYMIFEEIQVRRSPENEMPQDWD